MNVKQIICIVLFMFIFILFWETTARDYESNIRPSKGLIHLSELLIELFEILGRQVANIGTLLATLWNWIEHHLYIYFKKYIISFKDIIYSFGLNLTAPFYFLKGYADTLMDNAEYYATKYKISDKVQQYGLYSALIVSGTIIIPMLVLYIIYVILRKYIRNTKYELYITKIITYMTTPYTAIDYANEASKIRRSWDEKVDVAEQEYDTNEEDEKEEEIKEKPIKTRRTNKRTIK